MPLPPHEAPGSGAQSMVGYSVDLSHPDGKARVILDIDARHLNRNGTLHGGIHAMMLDAAAGFAASRSLTGEREGEIVPVLTLSLNTSFMAGAEGGRVIATGSVTGGGRKVLFAQAQIRDEEDRLLSSGAGVFKRIGHER